MCLLRLSPSGQRTAVKKSASGCQHIDRDVNECTLTSSNKKTRAANPSKNSKVNVETKWVGAIAVFWTPEQKISSVCRMQEADETNRHQAIGPNLTLRVKTMCSVKTRSAQTVNFECTWHTHRHTKRTHQVHTGSLTGSEQRDSKINSNCAIEFQSFVCFCSFIH